MPPQRFETLNGSMDSMHCKQTEIIVSIIYPGSSYLMLLIFNPFIRSHKYHISYLSVTSNIEAIFRVVGAFICSNNDSKFIHFASQKRTSVIGPGYEFGRFNSSAESLLNTFHIQKSSLFYN